MLENIEQEAGMKEDIMNEVNIKKNYKILKEIKFVLMNSDETF